MTQFSILWRTVRETSEILGVSPQRVRELAREGRFGPNAYKKHDKTLNYNGAWLIPFPNDYHKESVGRPSKSKEIYIEF